MMKKSRMETRSWELFHYLVDPFTMANLINSTTTINMAEYNPNLPISLATFYSFCWSGVYCSSSFSNRALILPRHDCAPTTRTIIFPSPVSILVPLIRIGDGIWCLSLRFFSPFFYNSLLFTAQYFNKFLWMGSISPVMALSSVVISLDSMRMPSAGISIPSLIVTTSPVSTRSWWIYIGNPFRLTLTLFF